MKSNAQSLKKNKNSFINHNAYDGDDNEDAQVSQLNQHLNMQFGLAPISKFQ